MADVDDAGGRKRLRGRRAAAPADLPPRSVWKVLLGVLLLAAGVVVAFFAVALIFTVDDLDRHPTTGTSFPFATVGSVLVSFAVLGFMLLSAGWGLLVRR